MDRLRRVQELRDTYESALDEAERLRDEYHREIVKLHRSGMSLRDIADGLGISHQRVHQIVAPHEAPRSQKSRRVAAGGAMAALLLVFGISSAALTLGGRDNTPVQRATPSSQTTDSIRSFRAVVDPLASSTFTPSSLAARCGADVLRSGAVELSTLTRGKCWQSLA